MPSAFEIYKVWKTEFRDVESNAEVARRLARRWGMSEHGLRGTLYKINTVENKVKLSRYLVNADPIDPSVTHQRNIVSESNRTWQDQQTKWSSLDRPVVGVFVSDKHSPYHRHDAWALTVKILAALPHVDVVSVQNDWNDNHGWSLKWIDHRRAADKLWTEDLEYQDRLEQHDYETIKMVAPKATLVAIMGNHDRWLYDSFRDRVPSASEQIIAQRMQWLYSQGVLQFTRGYHEAPLRMSPNLVWVHGKWAAQMATTNARNAARHFTEQGVASCVVYGHTHRGSMVDGSQIGINGIKIINNHGLRRSKNIPFLALGDAPQWTLGVTICYFRVNTRFVHFDMVQYFEDSNMLYAVVNGTRHEVDLERG